MDEDRSKKLRDTRAKNFNNHCFNNFSHNFRLDGVETLANVIATLLSPYIFKSFGYMGSYAASAIVLGCAILYLTIFVKEPIQREPKPNKDLAAKVKSVNITRLGLNSLSLAWIAIKVFFDQAVVIPIKGMKSVVMQDRKRILKILIFIQFFCNILYWLAINEFSLVRKTFFYLIVL